jgi:hypothetical protein
VREFADGNAGRAMLNFPALDVAIGLIFLFFILSVICSGINEAIASGARWRAQDLEQGLWELLEDPKRGSEALEKLKAHPLIHPMLNPKNKGEIGAAPAPEAGPPKRSRKTDFPAYIPSRTFTSALLGLEQQAVSAAKGVDVKEGMRTLDESIDAIPSERVQKALTALLHNAQGDAVVFRHNVEQWYDDHMERVSGWYRRRIQKVLWILAFLIAFTLNADSLQVAKRLWVEPSVRASLVSQAQNTTNQDASTADPAAELDSLAVPLGWHLDTTENDPQGFPLYWDRSMWWSLLSKLIGLTLTAVAISFGAPFWFDTLSKLARLRNGGAPPPASDAVRRGEGEETRRGDNAVLATALLEAVSKRGESDLPAATTTKPEPPAG